VLVSTENNKSPESSDEDFGDASWRSITLSLELSTNLGCMTSTHSEWKEKLVSISNTVALSVRVWRKANYSSDINTMYSTLPNCQYLADNFFLEVGRLMPPSLTATNSQYCVCIAVTCRDLRNGIGLSACALHSGVSSTSMADMIAIRQFLKKQGERSSHQSWRDCLEELCCWS
jgi:hypothetical protein